MNFNKKFVIFLLLLIFVIVVLLSDIVYSSSEYFFHENPNIEKVSPIIKNNEDTIFKININNETKIEPYSLDSSNLFYLKKDCEKNKCSIFYKYSPTKEFKKNKIKLKIPIKINEKLIHIPIELSKQFTKLQAKLCHADLAQCPSTERVSDFFTIRIPKDIFLRNEYFHKKDGIIFLNLDSYKCIYTKDKIIKNRYEYSKCVDTFHDNKDISAGENAAITIMHFVNLTFSSKDEKPMEPQLDSIFVDILND